MGTAEVNDVTTRYLQPTYQLRYGTTGESYALLAAARATPSLPDDVIRRAADLMNREKDGNQAGLALQNHMLALESERYETTILKENAYNVYSEVEGYKQDMLAKLQASQTQLARLESRLEAIFETLKREKENGNSYQLVRDSLSELRLFKAKVMEFGSDDMDEDDDEDGLDDVERFVASWLYDNKPLSEPVDYDDFEDDSDMRREGRMEVTEANPSLVF
jgi:hypothetical protein